MQVDVRNLPNRLKLARSGLPFTNVTYQKPPVMSIACPGRDGRRYQSILRHNMERVRMLQNGRFLFIGKLEHLTHDGKLKLTPERIEFLTQRASLDGKRPIPFQVVEEMGTYRTISIEVLEMRGFNTVDCLGNVGGTLSYHSFMALYKFGLTAAMNVSIHGTLPEAIQANVRGEVVRLRSWQGAGLLYGVLTPRKFIR